MTVGPLGSQEPLVGRHDAVFLDLDGVLYVGPRAVPGAASVMEELRRRSVPVAFLTNNASRTPDAVAEHLLGMGILAAAEEVVTSAQAAAGQLAADLPPGSRVLVIGGAGLRQAVVERGLSCVDRASDEPVAVVQGFDAGVGWRHLAEGAYAVAAGVPWYASNLDRTIPTADGVAPGNGALIDVVAQVTGRRPGTVAGKPHRALYDAAVARTAASRALMVGDRLDTDIEFANRVGLDSLLVLTGVTGLSELLRAGEAQRPTYVSSNLRDGLLEPHAPVVRDGGTWTCGGWTVRSREEELVLAGGGGQADAVRALCAAGWTEGRSPSEQAGARLAEQVLSDGACPAP